MVKTREGTDTSDVAPKNAKRLARWQYGISKNDSEEAMMDLYTRLTRRFRCDQLECCVDCRTGHQGLWMWINDARCKYQFGLHAIRRKRDVMVYFSDDDLAELVRNIEECTKHSTVSSDQSVS